MHKMHVDTIEAYILQTFHILQNFKSYHKTICSERFCINLLLLPVLKWVPCGSPFFWEEGKILKKLHLDQSQSRWVESSTTAVLWLAICRIWKSCKIYSTMVYINKIVDIFGLGNLTTLTVWITSMPFAMDIYCGII